MLLSPRGWPSTRTVRRVSTRTSLHRWRLFSAVPRSANCRISAAMLDLSGEARYGPGRQIRQQAPEASPYTGGGGFRAIRESARDEAAAAGNRGHRLRLLCLLKFIPSAVSAG